MNGLTSGLQSLAPTPRTIPTAAELSAVNEGRLARGIATSAAISATSAILPGLVVPRIVSALALGATLPADIAATFLGGKYGSTVLKEAMDVYRYSGGVAQPAGRFLTTANTVSQISSPAAASIALRLPAGATAEALNSFTIPVGTRIFAGGIEGGADTATQIFLRNSSVLIPR